MEAGASKCQLYVWVIGKGNEALRLVVDSDGWKGWEVKI